jgi:hypothetical protein
VHFVLASSVVVVVVVVVVVAAAVVVVLLLVYVLFGWGSVLVALQASRTLEFVVELMLRLLVLLASELVVPVAGVVRRGGGLGGSPLRAQCAPRNEVRCAAGAAAKRLVWQRRSPQAVNRHSS